jgi:hypothetical protein
MTRSRDVADTQDNLGGAVAPVVSGKNAIINGGFDIWQRGTSIANNATYTLYCADRFQINRGGLETGVTVSRQATNDTTNLPFIRYAARVQRNSGNTTTGQVSFLTSLETSDSIRFAGRTITLSFYARKGANYSQSSSQLNAVVSTGTGTDESLGGGYTGQATVLNQTATLTTTWQRFEFTASVSSTATEIGAWFYYVPVGTAGANDWYEITGIQLELGSVATPFSRAGGSIGGELALCQRYYWRSGGNTTNQKFGQGLAISTTQLLIQVQSPVAMRVAPTSIDYSTIIGVNATAALTPSAVVINNAAPLVSEISMTVSGATANLPYIMSANSSTSAYVGLSAEL